MRLSLHQLAVFAKVAEMQSVSRAAERLHMTQPAVSIHIRKLEEYYGQALIEIVGKKLQLTAAGQSVYQAQQDIAARLAALETKLADLHDQISGNLNLTVVSASKYFISQYLAEFKKRHAGANIKLNIATRNEALDRLNQNRDDCIVLSQLPDDKSIVAHFIAADSFVIAVPVEHHLAHKTVLSLKDLASEPWIWREAGSGTRTMLDNLFNKAKLQPNILMEVGSNAAAKQAVISGIGISLLSKRSIEVELASDKLVMLNVKGFPIPRQWYALYKKTKKLSLVATSWLTFLQQKAQAEKTK